MAGAAVMFLACTLVKIKPWSKCMRVKYFTSAAAAVAFGTCAMVAQANNGNMNPDGNWMPKQPENRYWQAPDWSNYNVSPGNRQSRQTHTPQSGPGYNNAYRPAPPAMQQPPMQRSQGQRPPMQQSQGQRPPMKQSQGQRPPMQQSQGQRPPMQRSQGQRPPMQRPAQAPGAERRPEFNRPDSAAMAPPAANINRMPPPPMGPYNSGMRGPDNGASAFNVPGYNRYRNNRRDNNKFWGRSGPSKWMNPNKMNMERGWDDMINAPSRMGEMPGGWTAPEVSVPNPVDMGDQIQENLEDLPEQVRDMDVGDN